MAKKDSSFSHFSRTWLNPKDTDYVAVEGVSWEGDVSLTVKLGSYHTAEATFSTVAELDQLIKPLIAARLWMEGHAKAQKAPKAK